MAIKTTERLEEMLQRLEKSGQSESRVLADFVRDILDDGDSCDGLIQGSMQEFIDAATVLMKIAEDEKL